MLAAPIYINFSTLISPPTRPHGGYRKEFEGERRFSFVKVAGCIENGPKIVIAYIVWTVQGEKVPHLLTPVSATARPHARLVQLRLNEPHAQISTVVHG